MKKRRDTIILRAGATLVAGALLTVAAPSGLQADERERNEVHEAVERGEVRSLADILTALRDKLPGEVVGVEIEREEGRWMYEFRVVDNQGRLFEVYVDARTAAIERVKEK